VLDGELFYSCCLCCAEVRLGGSGLSYKGRLEISYGGIWGTVCDDGFANDDANVACYMLGFGYVSSFISSGDKKYRQQILLIC